MNNELECDIEDYNALSKEIEHYKIGESAYNTQQRCLLTTYASLKRNIAELTLCQKCIGTLSVISILNDVAYTLFYTVEEMDGEWNFPTHQIGIMYSHVGSETMRPIAATHLLSPFESVFHTVSRCVNEQFVRFFCSNSAHSEYIAEVYINMSAASLAFGYFLIGPSSSLLQIIRFLRNHADLYYSKGKVDKNLKHAKDGSDENSHDKAIELMRHQRSIRIQSIQIRLNFLEISGMLQNNGIHPEIFILDPTYIIDSTPQNQFEYQRVVDIMKKLIPIRTDDEEPFFLGN